MIGFRNSNIMVLQKYVCMLQCIHTQHYIRHATNIKKPCFRLGKKIKK